MPTNDSLLFIDANKYLDLYRLDKGQELLEPLKEQKDYIFVTQQVVNEVLRNRVNVAEGFLKKKSDELEMRSFNLPAHLFNDAVDQQENILDQMNKVRGDIGRINKSTEALLGATMEGIIHSTDSVSKALSEIFANAKSHTSEELQRARDRRELGNPPGKRSDPIGDQLHWEQILTHFKDKKRLWIISRDGDYGKFYNEKKGFLSDLKGKTFLNHVLYGELCKITPEPEVYLFQGIVEGINHFVEKTGVKAEQRLTPEEEEEIKREEKALSITKEILLDKLRLSEELRVRLMIPDCVINEPELYGEELHRFVERVNNNLKRLRE